MTPRPPRSAMVSAALLLAVAGCIADASPSPRPEATPGPTIQASPTASATPSPSPSPPASPTPTPEPTLSLDLPEVRDDRRVGVSLAAEVPADDDGQIVVTVVSAADTMIDELVLRWPEALHDTIFPAPFVPSPERIRDGGDPLRQTWTKWVVGPGEQGEPAGTVSLGYGPLPAGGTLEILLHVTRQAPGAVAFDLQVLAGEELLTLEDDEPAELRVEVP
jgi:hypothetical protein